MLLERKNTWKWIHVGEAIKLQGAFGWPHPFQNESLNIPTRTGQRQGQDGTNKTDGTRQGNKSVTILMQRLPNKLGIQKRKGATCKRGKNMRNTRWPIE